MNTLVAAAGRRRDGSRWSTSPPRPPSPPQELVRAIARQAEAERERRAKVIANTGELEARRELARAATKRATAPGARQLRTLQTLAEVATEKYSTLIFPIPVELLAALQSVGNR